MTTVSCCCGHARACAWKAYHVRLGFDLRPFLYPSRFPFQFAKIDALAESLPDRTLQATAEKAKVE